MAKKIPFTFVWLLLGLMHTASVKAQFYPADGDTLTQTTVCFTFPWHFNADSYSLALVDESTPRQVMSHTGKGNKIIVKRLLPGHTYTWFVASLNGKGETVDVSHPTRFSIAPYPEGVRFVSITHDSTAYTDNLLLLDYAHAAFTRKGEVQWFLPGITPNTSIRDLRLTEEGTVTAIIDSNALEMDLRGRVLWKAPLRGPKPDYHHSFTKLPSGNYLVVGCDFRRYPVPGRADSAWVDVGTVIEFSPEGQVHWQWNGRDFFKPEWITFKQGDKGVYTGSVHLNAVSADAGFVYAGYRDAGWVLKIRRATKKVEYVYGGRNSQLPGHYGQGLFRQQHDAHILADGSLAVVNNDSVEVPAVVSSVLVLSQGKSDPGAKLFEFPFNFDGKTNGKSLKLGSVCELPNGNLLINMGAINRILEVTRDKKVVWDVWVEKFDTFKKHWRFFSQYHVAAASSLYPNEFCVRAHGRWDKKGWTGSCFLLNVGSEANRYSFWSEKNGKPVQLGITGPIPSGGSVTQSIRISGVHNRLTVRVEGKSKYETMVLPENSTVF